MKTIITYIALMLIAFSANGATLAQQADSAYSHERYSDAVALYTQSLCREGRTATTYYNLANAYYRANDLGHAVINYERALRIDPSNEDARVNLEFVNERIQDKPEDDTSYLTLLHRSIVRFTSPDSWAYLAIIAFMLLLGAVALYIFAGNVTLRKVGFFGGIAMLVITVYVAVVSYDSASAISRTDEAVVIVPTTMLNSVPRAAKANEKVVPIHEGTKIIIVDSIATPDDPESPMWYDVKINNSTRAWVRATDVEKI